MPKVFFLVKWDWLQSFSCKWAKQKSVKLLYWSNVTAPVRSWLFHYLQARVEESARCFQSRSTECRNRSHKAILAPLRRLYTHWVACRESHQLCHLSYESNIELPKHRRTEWMGWKTSRPGGDGAMISTWVALHEYAPGLPREWLLAAGWGRCRLTATEAHLMCIFYIWYDNTGISTVCLYSSFSLNMFPAPLPTQAATLMETLSPWQLVIRFF